MRYLKLSFALFIALILLTVFTVILPFPQIAHAQDPTPETICITDTNIIIHPDAYLGVDVPSGIDVIDPSNMLGPADGITGQIGDYSPYGQLGDFYTCAYFNLPGIVSTVDEGDEITITTQYVRGAYQENLFTYPTNGQTSENSTHNLANEGWQLRHNYYYSSDPFTGTVGTLGLCAFYSQIFGGWGYNTVDAITVTVRGQYCYDNPTLYTCPTLNDYHFTLSDTWTLDGSATILSSTLTLNPTGAASQTLSTTLQSGTTYNAVLSITNAISAPLVVSLGSQSQTLTIDAAGRYTATFTATETIANPAYLLRNDGESEHYVDVDWTCVYSGSSVITSTGCIAPLNGEFATADNWDFFRGAAYNSPSQNALLPFNQGSDASRSLVMSSGAYSLPALSAGQYLTLRFSGASQTGQDALVSSKVLSSWNEFQITSSDPVIFYADISSQAGLSATIAFANSGSANSAGAEECQYSAQDGLLIDDVCIYVSTTPAQSTAVVTNTFCPVDLGFDFGCNDVNALLAGYGINVYAVEPIYNAGPTWADPSGYFPWLAAALWLHVGKPISCFLVEFMRLVVDMVEYQVNVFANFVGWDYQTITAAAPWLQTGLGKIPVYSGLWSSWNANSDRNVGQNVGANWLAQTIWSQSANQTQASSVGCLQSTVAGGFNGLGSGLGGAISQVMNTLVDVWNNSILVYFSLAVGDAGSIVPITDPAVPDSPWSGVLDMFLWLIRFMGQIVSTVWSLLRWLVSFITTGATAPIDAYHSFTTGMASDAYVIDVACVADNWWCVFWGGVALVNATSAESILYPIVITGIVCLTLVIVFKNLYEMFHIDI